MGGCGFFGFFFFFGLFLVLLVPLENHNWYMDLSFNISSLMTFFFHGINLNLVTSSFEMSYISL